MHTLRSAALLLAIAMLAPAQPAAACLGAWSALTAMDLVDGIPDRQGMINGKPNNNRVRIGQDILFLLGCEAFCGREVTMKLHDQASQADIPVTFEPIAPSKYWRVRPAQPLAAGMYMLTYTGTIAAMKYTEVQEYVFRVEGEAAAATPAELQVIMDQEPEYETAGHSVACGILQGECPTVSSLYTQSRPWARIWCEAVVDPIPDEQRALFLYRMLPAGNATAEQTTNWEYYSTFTARSEKKQYLRAPETCWVTQALRFSDGQITSSEPHCFSYNADIPDTYPGVSKPCKETTTPTEYIVAWCEDNRASCAPDNPRAASTELQKACATYADACAPLLGKRAANLGTCTP